MSGRRALAERVSPALLGALLVLALAATVVLSVGVGSTPQPPATCLRGVLATSGSAPRSRSRCRRSSRCACGAR